MQKSFNQTKPVNEDTHERSDIPILDMRDPQFPFKIVETFRNIGFVIVQNHGISDQEIDQAFQVSRSFFQLPMITKQSIKFDATQSKGYNGPDGEILDESNLNNEKKETLNIGNLSCEGNDKFYPEDQ